MNTELEYYYNPLTDHNIEIEKGCGKYTSQASGKIWLKLRA